MRKYKCKYDIDFQNIKDILDFTSGVYGDKTAIIYKTPDRKKVINKSYRQLRCDVDLAAAYLLNEDLKGKRIAIIGNNSYEWLLAYYGILIGVGVVVPLDKGLTEQEVINSLRKCKAEAIIFDESLELDISKITWTDGVSTHKAIPVSSFEPDKLAEHTDLFEKQKDNFKEIDNDAADIILFTSGTTTESKAAMLSQRNIAFDIAAMRKVEPIYEDDIAMIVMPFHHAFGSTGLLFLMS